MKTLSYLPILFFSLISCTNNDSIPQQTKLLGKWKLIERKYSDGGNTPNWISVPNGFSLTLNTNNTYLTTEYSDCNSGTFNFQNDIITYTNSCGNLTIPNKFKVVSVTKNELIISNVDCIEECKDKFEKIE